VSSAVPQATLAQWQQKGATEAPPAPVGAVTLGSVQVVNDTRGAVSDADARRWALAYVRANAYEFWAWNNMQDGFLLRSGLSQTPTSVFGYDLSTMGQAGAVHQRVEVTRLVLRRIVVRAVPQSLTATFAKQAFQWTPYALFLDQIGPSDLSFVDAQGKRTIKAHVDPGAASPELVGGELATDPVMGEIWVSASDWDCSASGVRQAFGTLCNA
jgi:hypothetical protein